MIDIDKIEAQEKNFEKEVGKLKEKYSEREEANNLKWVKTVGAILVKDGKVLLVNRGHEPFRYTWTLPGGHIDEGETDIQAVVREVKEETGFDFKPNYFVDISGFLESKLGVMSIYQSEMGECPFPRSPEVIRALATWRGSTAGFVAAEAFELLRERS